MGKVNIDFTPTKYNADDAPDLVTGAYNQSMDDLKVALDNATAEDSGGGGDITYPIPIDKGGTNANNAADAANNLQVYGLSGGTEIPASANLNVYLTIGNYYCGSDSDAKTLVNCPTNNAFTLRVINSTGINYPAQILMAHISGKTYYRYYDSVSHFWTKWVKYADSTDLAKYLPLTGGTVTGALTLNRALGVSSGGTGAKTAEQARENLGIVDPTPVYVETEETSEPGLHIIVDSENNVLKIKKV